MSSCCSNNSNADSYPKKRNCPSNGIECHTVSTTTIKHHLKQPWLWQEKQQGYYFCADPECQVIYFGEDESILDQSSLRTLVGVKHTAAHSALCYCYGVSKNDYLNNPEIIEFVKRETKSKSCACETSNPSGKCCLKDFKTLHAEDSASVSC